MQKERVVQRFDVPTDDWLIAKRCDALELGMLGDRGHILFPPRQSSLLLGDVQELGESGLDLLLGLFAHLVEIGQTRVECT